MTTLIKGQISLPIDHEIRTRLEAGRADTLLHIVPHRSRPPQMVP